MPIVYASFEDAKHAEKAAGALLDHGLQEEDLSFVRGDVEEEEWRSYEEGRESEDRAEAGVTTTSGGDVVSGAAKGGGWGLLVGAVAGLTALWAPPVGLVLGGGALSTALAGTAGGLVAGAIAGGVTGYLKDQGVPHETACDFSDRLEAGGAILELALPSGELGMEEACGILDKYDATRTTVEE